MDIKQRIKNHLSKYKRIWISFSLLTLGVVAIDLLGVGVNMSYKYYDFEAERSDFNFLEESTSMNFIDVEMDRSTFF